MTVGNHLAQVAAAVGDPARANILTALLDGRALTAKELAYAARVTPQTTSGHLARLTEAGLLERVRQGRHRYYRLASPLVARLLESLMVVAAAATPRPTVRIDEGLRAARACYDHLAGRLGVGLADTLQERGHVVFAGESGALTEAGVDFFAGFGVELPDTHRSRRALCRPCLDWSERRPHLAGALGAALATRCFDLGWLKRQRDGRALTVTPAGHAGFAEVFELKL
jgi:DNA-binding transcriptional ArsR family regulator